ncbi:MAG: Spx/MgsR family RNA polymerase-binding regulatory protein [Hyphomicrobiaceae bacterium]
MAAKLFGLKACDTCRKALKAFEGAGKSVTFHDVRADGVAMADLKTWAKAVDWQVLLNTRSTTWRGLDDSQKADLDEGKALALMLEYPTLIKRPVIVANKSITVGWSKDTQNLYGV